MLKKTGTIKRAGWATAALAFAALFMSGNSPLLPTVAAQAGLVRRIDVRIRTANVNGAGTDDGTYISLGGREFRLDHPGVNDLEKGTDSVFIFGEATNVNNGSQNDPRHPQLTIENVRTFPIYIRKEPDKPNGEWAIQSVTITLNPGPGQVAFARTFPVGDPLWLRTFGGLQFYVK